MPCGIMCVFGLEIEGAEGGTQCDMSRNPSGPWEFGQLEIGFCSVQFSCSVMSDSLRPHGLQNTNSRSLLKLVSIELVMPSNHLILCRLLFFLPSIFPSIRVFSNESLLCIRWPKYWSLSLSISPSKEYSGLTSFRMD